MKKLLLLIILWFPAAQASESPVILVMGDSLSAAYDIPSDSGWVVLLQNRLQREGYPHEVVNASISGETSRGGLARLPQLLKIHDPDYMILALGANDGLRGQSVITMQNNLRSMVELAQEQEPPVKTLVLGMQIPPNYGRGYTERFYQAFADVAGLTDSAYHPFFLHKIAKRKEYFLADGVHPNEQAQPIILDTLWETIEAWITATDEE